MIEEKLVTPPIRAALLEEKGRDADAKTPSRNWWLHWNTVTLRANQNAAEIDQLETDVAQLKTDVDALEEAVEAIPPSLYGTHAARPAANSVPEDALYIETDRDNVIYQARNVAGTPAWIYVAGIMWDTISPDNRPAGLGPNDANFYFRATESPAAYRWSGSAWVDITPPAPVTGAANLIHPNVVPKVGSAGQLVEGGITDESAANSDRLHVTAAGNIGMGNAAAVLPDAQVADVHVIIGSTTGTTFGRVNVATSQPTLTAFAGSYAFANYANPGTDKRIAMINGWTDGAINSGAILFYAFSGGSAAERMRITSAGNVGIGTTNPLSRLSVIGLPTSAAGLGSGDIWRDPAAGNVLKIVP